MQIGFDHDGVMLVHRDQANCLMPAWHTWWWRGHLWRYRGETDGMSSPKWTHALKGMESYGWALRPAVAHDGGYKDGLEIWRPTGFEPMTLSKDDCDVMLHDLLLCLAGADTERQRQALVIYEAVHLFGQTSFAEDRAHAAEIRARHEADRLAWLAHFSVLDWMSRPAVPQTEGMAS
ncbi:MAG: hypothetical protein KGL39_22920 [Patescibacteria group bacterium]|nr:hypothetical protein [Patescibacteria group bacterium]